MPDWIIIEESDYDNSAAPHGDKWKIKLSKEDGFYKSTVFHELGHVFMFEHTFGKRLKKPNWRPSLDEAGKYAVTTYRSSQPDPAEGWAESFTDYYERREYLKKESPELYRFWHSMEKQNVVIEKTAKNIKNL